MAFQKGHTKKGGRVKGTAAKTVRAICEAKGCNPAALMADFALDTSLDAAFRGRMAAELLRYIYPQLKAVEHSGPGGGPIEGSGAVTVHVVYEDRPARHGGE